jgi:hypothetical protein
MSLFRKPKFWWCLFLAALLALLLFVPIKNALDVAAIQNAVQRDWEINFVEAPRSMMTKPAILPARIDSAAESLFDRMFVHTSGYEGQMDEGDVWLSPASRAAIKAALPNISLYLGDPE